MYSVPLPDMNLFDLPYLENLSLLSSPKKTVGLKHISSFVASQTFTESVSKILKQSSVRQSIEKTIFLFFWSMLYTKRAVVYFLNNSDKIDSMQI